MLYLDRWTASELTLMAPHRKGFHLAAIFSKKYINIVATLPVRANLRYRRTSEVLTNLPAG